MTAAHGAPIGTRHLLAPVATIAHNPGSQVLLQAAAYAARRAWATQRRGLRRAMLLMIDNYDSFTWNLVQYL
ncbi:MAG: hypothetical protein M3Q13_00490, partial [Pseudomonadota bacterium]|nr:hypothetical protein [Pseudomonadota bacterium]